MRFAPTLLILVLGLPLTSCSETEFGSNTGSKDGGKSVPDEPSEPTATPKPCIDGDQINLKFPPNIQTCVDAGNIFDFDRGKCTTVRKAPWSCDWDTLQEEMADINTSSSKVKAAESDGSKLVSCGQSESGDLIVAQWWDAKRSEVADCQFGSGKMMIVTGCYGDLPTNKKTENLSEAERQKIVSDCLKILVD